MTLTTPPEFVPLGATRDEKHVYAWNDGTRVYWPLTSVTTALRVIDKPAVQGWIRRTTAEFAVDNLEAIGLIRSETGRESAVDFVKRSTDRRRDSAAQRGTNVHAIAEQIIRGTPPTDIPEDAAPFVQAYLGFIRHWRPQWLAVEQMVFNLRHGYAGTFDAFAVIGNERWCLDVKTSSGVYAETALQLASYAAAEFMGRPGDVTRYAVPRAKRFGVIHVTEAGAELVPYDVTRDTFRAFLEALRLWQWTQGPARTIVGKPLEGKRDAA